MWAVMAKAFNMISKYEKPPICQKKLSIKKIIKNEISKFAVLTFSTMNTFKKEDENIHQMNEINAVK